MISWQVDLPARGSVDIEWWIEVEDDGGVVAAGPQAPSWSVPIVEADDRRLVDLVRQSLKDLHGLRMVTTDRPCDVFVAAGAPWFLTLFGRDSGNARFLDVTDLTGYLDRMETSGRRVNGDSGQCSQARGPR